LKSMMSATKRNNLYERVSLNREQGTNAKRSNSKTKDKEKRGLISCKGKRIIRKL